METQKVIVLGGFNCNNEVVSERLEEECIKFFHGILPESYYYVSIPEELFELLEKNPNSLLLYVGPIPEMVFRELSENKYTAEILSIHNVTIGYIKIIDGKIKELRYLFNGSGKIDVHARKNFKKTA